MSIPFQSSTDVIAARLAAFATQRRPSLLQETGPAAKSLLLDTIAVVIAAGPHPAASIGSAYAYKFRPDGDCTLWGTHGKTDAETAALVNATRVRCYDFNDVYIGTKNWGHPSDTIAPLVAIAESLDLSGAELLEAISVSIEVVVALFDTVPASASGWDYSLLTMIGAVCGIGRLSNMTQEKIEHALSIAVIPHFPSNEVESGDLNKSGDLTLWKRFNTGDAMRHAVYAYALASVGAEGVVRPFTGSLGFCAKLGLDEKFPSDLEAALVDVEFNGAFDRLLMKRWPVGSRAQSAIQAALVLRESLSESSEIASVRIVTDPSVYDHLVQQRPNAWNPGSREMADHSLPYIVAAVLATGRLDSTSFDDASLVDPEIRRLLAATEIEPTLYEQAHDELEYARRGYLSKVEITLTNGQTRTGPPEIPPGHPRKPMSQANLEAKLKDNAPRDCELSYDQIVTAISNLEQISTRDLTTLLTPKKSA